LREEELPWELLLELVLELPAFGEAARFLAVVFLTRFLGAESASTRSASFAASLE
jgi:hypothetical protein